MKKFKRLVLGLFTFLFAFSSASCNLTGMLGGISLSDTESEANSDVASEPMGSISIESNTPSEDTPSTNTYINKLYESYDELLEVYNKALRDSSENESRLERLENLENQIESILYQINMYAENGKLSFSEYRSLLNSINNLKDEIDYILNSEEPVFMYTIHFYDEYGNNYDKWTSSEGEVFELPYLERENHEAYWYDIEYGSIYYNFSTIVLDRDYHLQERYVPSDDYSYNTLEGIADLPDGTWVDNIEVVVNVNYGNQHFVSDRYGNDMLIYGSLKEFNVGETYVISGAKSTYEGYPEIITPVINESRGYSLGHNMKEIYWWNVNEEWVKENNYEYYVIREAEVISYIQGGNSIIKVGDMEITFSSRTINEVLYQNEIIDLYCTMNAFADGSLIAKASSVYRHNPINKSCEIFVDANGDFYYESTYNLNYGDTIYLYPVFDYANQSFASWEIIEYDQYGNQSYLYNYDYELKYSPYCVRAEIRVNYVEVDASTLSIDTDGDGYFDGVFSGYKGEIVEISASYDPVQYYFVGWEITTTDQYGNTNKYMYSYDSHLVYSFDENINAEIVVILGENDIDDDNLSSNYFDVTFNYDSWQEGVTVWTDFAVDGTIAPDPLGISEKDLSGCHTVPLADSGLDVGSYYFAIDANGYIVYASYGLGVGYGSPTDGYYHNQDSKDPWAAEYWSLHDEWNTWPNKTSDGRNAWTLYDFIIPEGGFVIKGYAKDPEFVQIWTLLTGQPAAPVATNVTLEGTIAPGALNNWYFSIDKNHQLKIRERLESEMDNGFGEQEKETPAVDFVPTIDDDVKTYNTLEGVADLADDTIIENIKVVVVWLRGSNAIVQDVQENTILIYDNAMKDVAVGDTIVLGSAMKTTYNGYPELKNSADVQILTTYGKLPEVAPIELTAENVAEYWVEANNYGFFKLVGAQVIATNKLQLGDTVIDLYSTTFPEGVQVGDIIDITLTMQCYKSAVQGKGNPEDIYRYYNIEIDANGDEIVDYYESYPYGFEKQLYAENFDDDYVFKHWVKITTNEYGEEIYQEISTEHNPFILIEEDAKYVAVYDYAAWTDLPVNYYEALTYSIKGENMDCGGDALSVITDGIIHVDGQWANTTYGGSANWRFIAVIDNEGKVAYAVNNPANGYGGPNGTSYYAHPDYADDYTTNPALNILEGYGPWTPEDNAYTKFEIVVPEGGFILISHGAATQTLVGSLASDTFADDYSDGNINRRGSLDENARVYYDALNNWIRVFRYENLVGYQYQAVLNDVSDDYVSVYDSSVENVSLGDFTVAIDVNGKIIFAGKTAPGYGGPADGFYHDGNYYWVPGEHNGIFVLDPEFATWPNTASDGRNAWMLYTVKAPEGGYIITGKEYQMYELLFNIDNKFSLSGNYYEGLADGCFNDTHAIAMACGITMAAFDLHINEKTISNSMIYTGSMMGEFTYNYDTGLFETRLSLDSWHSVYFTYFDENGNEQQLTYNNTSFVGNITSDPSIFGAYSEGAGVLFIEEGWPENGKFMSSETVTLNVTFDPNTYTLTVLKDGEEIVVPDLPEVEEPEENKPLRYEYIAIEEGVCVETNSNGWNPLNYNIVVDGNGKIIYASYGSMGYLGYGGPGDGFYHDGTYQVIPGQVCGAFELYYDWAAWPSTTTSGMNAWERYNPYIPENGFAIMSNDENAILKIANQLFDLNYATLPTNNYLFESELVDGAYNNVVVSYYYPTSKPSVAYEGTYMDTFEYNEETGLYETTITLQSWNHVIFKYYDENGNSIPLTYKTANLVGNFTSEDLEGADWTENLFHEKDEKGIDWAEYGKFMACMEASYYVTFDPNTMTLNVKYAHPDTLEIEYSDYYEINGIKVYSSGKVEQLDEMTVAVNSEGTIIYINRTDEGYTHPENSFYHDGLFFLQAGTYSGIYYVGVEYEMFSEWNSHGQKNVIFRGKEVQSFNAFDFVVPSGGYILTGSVENMTELLNQIDAEWNGDVNYFAEIEDRKYSISLQILVDRETITVHNRFNGYANSVVYVGSTEGEFSYNEEKGLYEATIELNMWNNVVFSMIDEEGNSIILYYNNCDMIGNITASYVNGCDWTENLYHDDDSGEFYTYTGGTYYVTFDPNTMTLNVEFL